MNKIHSFSHEMNLTLACPPRFYNILVCNCRCRNSHWPDFSDKDDLSKLGAEAFAFVNFARFAVPLRIGLALGTTPWIQENIVDVFLLDKEGKDDEGKETVDVIEEEAVEPDEDIKNEGGRLRILSRLRNLKNRVFKRKSRDEQDDKE